MLIKNMRNVFTTVLLGSLVACGDLGPTGPSPSDDLVLHSAQDLNFEDGRLALTWLDPLEEEVSVTQTFGVWGGTLELETGLRLWVPPFALEEDLEITMSARSGEDVAFDFGPHGTTFRHDVWVSIDLSKVRNGLDLTRQLSQCREPESVGGLAAASAQTASASSSKGGKKGKKGKKGKQENEDNEDNEESTDSTDSTSNWGSWGTLGTSTSDLNCSFSWMEKLEGLDGVYMDPDVTGAQAGALEDFEVWVWGNQWLTFKTDHFSGYALAM